MRGALFDPVAIRFVVIGSSNALLSFLAFDVGLLLLPPFTGRATAAQAIAYLGGIVWSFGWNRRWTFRSTASVSGSFAAFLALQLLLLVTSSGAVGLAVDVLDLPATPSWLAIMAFVTVVNYLAQRHLVFARRRATMRAHVALGAS